MNSVRFYVHTETALLMVRAEVSLEVSVGTSSVLRSFWSAIPWIRPLMLHLYRPSPAGQASIAPLTLEGLL